MPPTYATRPTEIIEAPIGTLKSFGRVRIVVGGLAMRRRLLQVMLVVGVTALASAICSPIVGDDHPPAINVKTARPQLMIQLGHASAVTWAAISPDGKQVLTGSNDFTARLWDTESGKEIRRFEGHTGPVNSVAFSPDGKQVLTGSNDTTTRLWDAGTGSEIRRFETHASWVNSVGFSRDGTQIVTGCSDGTAQVWDANSGKEIRRFARQIISVNSVVFSPDGNQVLAGCWDNRARLWDVATGKEVRRFDGHSRSVKAVAFSRDGTQVLTGSEDHTARLWDAATGKEIRSFVGHTDTVVAVEFSPDGTQVLTAGTDRTARLWDAATGKEIRRFGDGAFVASAAFSRDGRWVLTCGFRARLWERASGKLVHDFKGLFDMVESVAFSPNGQQVLTGSRDGMRLWDAASGKEVCRFAAHPTFVDAVAFSPDGAQLLIGSFDYTVRLLNTADGKQIRQFDTPNSIVTSVAFSRDGKQVLAAVEDLWKDEHAALLWEVGSGKEIRRFAGHFGSIRSVAFSPDGTQVLTGSLDGTARLWDTGSGEEILRFGHKFGVTSASISADGTRVLTGGIDDKLRLWDAVGGKEIEQFDGHSQMVNSVAFSPNGKQVLSGSRDNTARLWDVAGRKEIRRFEGHSGEVTAVGFSTDGTKVLTGSADCTSRIWDAATGEQLCTLIGSPRGEWAVVDPAGRFDGSNGGEVDGLHWVVGAVPIELSQLKERYYDPGLFAKKLGFNREPLRKVEAFTAPKLFPDVALVSPPQGKTHFDIHLANRGGGIGRVVVKINGKELTADARSAQMDPKTTAVTIPVDLAGDPRLKPGQKNVVEVQAFNAEGYLSSRGLEFDFDDPREATPAEKPNLWGLVIGVSRYQGGAINLRYAAKDAKDFSIALRIAGARLFGADKVHLTLLASAEPDPASKAEAPAKPDDATAPNRANIVAALKALQEPAKVKPNDILVVYMAGHGVTRSGVDEGFYYLTCDAQSAELSDPAVRQLWAVSDQELTAAIARSPALKQVMILDTCHSGRLIEDLTAKRDIPSNEVRALERIKDRTGLHILAGCASDAGSYEASRYGQGVLTYSLLLGMQGAALKEDQFVDVGTLFNFAADRVPALARDLGGIQRPVISSPKGSSFEIGEVTADDRKQIPLQRERPLVLRTVFQDEQSIDDVLELAKKVDEQFRGIEVRGTQNGVVFVDARAMPDSYRVVGRYKIEGEKATVSVSMFQDKKRIQQFTITGKTTAVDDLAGQIVAETEKLLASPNSQTPATDYGK